METVPAVEIPKDTANGDYTTTFCLAASKAMRKNPREVANILTQHMKLDGTYFTSVEIAGPGFLNFRLGEKWYADVVEDVEREADAYGRGEGLKGKKYMVEFVSANPTGPMHMGNARGGVLGDTLASVLDWSGANVWREFYVNDFGNQIEKFAKSIEARYQQLIKGEDAVEFPEDGYHGDDIRELAQAFTPSTATSYLARPRKEPPRRYGALRPRPQHPQDEEPTLSATASVRPVVLRVHPARERLCGRHGGELTEKGWTYEKDGALWLKTTESREQYCKPRARARSIDKLGLKDDVLRRANGFYTYFAADIAYHRNKFEVRGFDKVINIWGADHHGHVARLKGAMDALGLDGTNRLDIVLMQLVKLCRTARWCVCPSAPARPSPSPTCWTRSRSTPAATSSTPSPTSRWTSTSASPSREDSENPVYYVQYAHARICSLLKTMADEGRSVPAGDKADLSSAHRQERALIKELANFSEEIRMAARDYDPSYINRYLMRLAGAFHRFYNACRIKGEADDVANARLLLAAATRQVLAPTA